MNSIAKWGGYFCIIHYSGIFPIPRSPYLAESLKGQEDACVS